MPIINMVYKKPVPEPEWATQGPCPDGFHVPLSSDWNNVYNAASTFGLYDVHKNIRLPLCGLRNSSVGSVSNRGKSGRYWSSSRSSSSNAYNFTAYSDTHPGVYNNPRSCGFSIRPFKNEPTIPDSSWTVIKQGTGSAGIYHNSSLGLISISSNGSTRYTIADKNLGATEVWSSGTPTEANGGYYFQRGNNYGFPFNGSVTTSSTQVNASSYGPGNYYSSSTFILNRGRWDTTDNGNLRGGVDGNVPV